MEVDRSRGIGAHMVTMRTEISAGGNERYWVTTILDNPEGLVSLLHEEL
jgi:hypothetical protein